MTRKGQTFRAWSDDEERVLIELIRQNPEKTREDIARAATGALPHRTLSSILTRIKSSKAVVREWQETRDRIQAEVKPEPKAKATIEVSSTGPNGGPPRIIPVTIPTPPFKIEIGPRDESTPYDRRAAHCAPRARPTNIADIFKRTLREELNHERANRNEAAFAAHHEARRSIRL